MTRPSQVILKSTFMDLLIRSIGCVVMKTVFSKNLHFWLLFCDRSIATYLASKNATNRIWVWISTNISSFRMKRLKRTKINENGPALAPPPKKKFTFYLKIFNIKSFVLRSKGDLCCSGSRCCPASLRCRARHSPFSPASWRHRWESLQPRVWL